MSEINSVENDECDMEDLEHRLYARIHHYGGFDEEKCPSTSALQESSTDSKNSQIDNELNQNNNDQTPSDLAATENRFKKNLNRYWNNDTPSNQGKYHKAKTQSRHGNFTGNLKQDSVVASNSNAACTEDIIPKPKPFTPYISLLTVKSLPSTSKDSISNVSDLSEQSVQHYTKKSSNRIKKSSQHPNPFSKKCVIDQFKSTFDNLPKKGEFDSQNIKNRKRLNPFSAASQDRKKRKENNTEMAKKVMATKKQKGKQVPCDVIDIEDDDDNHNDDDDDVIIIPTQKPPLICVDSSDDEITETETEQEKNHQFIEPAALNKKSNAVRCDSPSSSIQSADDFVVHTDRRNYGFDNLVTLSDEDLYEASKTVENALRKNTESSPLANDAANDIFTLPKQIQTDKTKQPKRSYEVFENSFAAMDVYESESSDMPDSIYAKGIPRKRRISSDSDSDSVETVIVTKAKRLRKRKSSGSAKESEHLDSDESSCGIPANLESDEETEPNENSYIVRGEALGAVKNHNIKRSIVTEGSIAKLSDDEFMNKLSSILQDNTSDENEAADNDHDPSVESIGARDLAESVLQQRSKNKSIPSNSESIENETNPGESVGVRDDSHFDCMVNASFANDCNSAKGDETENRDNREEKREIGVEDGWNDEMKRFYNDSWGGELFSVKKIQSKMSSEMSRGSSNWAILSSDNFRSPDYSRHKIRCLNCHQRGHKMRSCPRPPKPKRCHMCGSEGHLISQCSHKICLYCGRNSKKFAHGCTGCDKERDAICFVCKRKGHKQNLCPDQWKRYHSTKIPASQLNRSIDISSAKTKFCPICANKGHTSDTCNSARRYIGNIPISLMQIINYRPVYSTKVEINPEQPTKCILTSSLDQFSFNLGSEVVPYGNRIYARFLRSVEMDPYSLSEKAATDEKGVTSVESTANIKEVDDSNDVSIIEEKIPQIDLNELASTDIDLSTSIDVTNDSVVTEGNDTAEQIVEEDKVEQSEELEILDRQMRTLDELKKKIMARNHRVNESEATDELPIYDLNSSSESVETKSALLDFIPLTSNEPEKFQPVRSPSPKITETKCDAKIYLTEEHCNALVTKEGHNFLTQCEEKHNVSITMEWKSIGNVLVVHGSPSDQGIFHEALINFFASIKKESASELSKTAPKKREALIKFIREELIRLDKPLYNHVNVDYLYNVMQKHLNHNTKAHRKKALRIRRQLNMILFGRYGFGEGKTHLQALQTHLRTLIENTTSKVSLGVRQKILDHLDYIFSSDDRENYIDLIDQYKDLKRQNNLPPLELDRKLLGLKINVFSGTSVNVTMKNTVSESSVSSPSELQHNNNRLNVMPSSIDIQINVSTPSSDSHLSKSSTDENITQKSAIPNEWKS